MSFKHLLNDSIIIKSRTTTTNAWGETISSWSTSQTIDARVYPITDEMRMTIPGQFQDAEYKAIIESSNSINYDDRVYWNNHDWKILSIIEDSHSHHYELLLKRLP